MTYQYSKKVGLKGDDKRPAGVTYVIEKLIERFEDQLPTVTTRHNTRESIVPITYAMEYIADLLELPVVAFSLVSEINKELGIGMDAGFEAPNELHGYTKVLLLNMDIWGRSAAEVQMISDAVHYTLNRSRHYFGSWGFRDLRPDIDTPRNFEQAIGAMYYRQSQQTTRAFRRVLTLRCEYDLVWNPNDPVEIIEQIAIHTTPGVVGTTAGATVTTLSSTIVDIIGGATELLLDGNFALEDIFGGFV